MSSSSELEQHNDTNLVTRREAVLRVSALLGGAVLVGGSALLTACEKEGGSGRTASTGKNIGTFTPDDVDYLDEIAETILPETSTPGAKAAKVGPFMALMVTDAYSDEQQRVFRDGMKQLDAASQKANGKSFMKAKPEQRLALLEAVDREQKAVMDARQNAKPAPGAKGPDTTSTGTPVTKGSDQPGGAERGGAGPKAKSAEAQETPATGITPTVTKTEEEKEEPPAHYFRMMKELALLGYFTSEIGYTKAMRYVESPGRFDPCAPYKPGERAWAPHA
jgi:hypothetical protein